MAEEREDSCTPISVLLCGDASRRIKAKRFRFCKTPTLCCRNCDGRDGCSFVCPKELVDEMEVDA